MLCLVLLLTEQQGVETLMLKAVTGSYKSEVYMIIIKILLVFVHNV